MLPKKIFVLSAAASVTIGVLALAFYLHPLFFFTWVTRFQLFREGAVSRYAKVCISSGCYQIHYYVAGEGTPVVLIHGVGGSGENWLGVLAAIKGTGLRVYLPDLLGFGRSEKPNVDYSIRLQAEIIHAFGEQLKLDKASVGGVSMGGWVALNLTARWPESVRRLLLVDSAGTRFTPDFTGTLFEPRTAKDLQRLMDRLTPNAPQLPVYIADDVLRTAAPSGWVIQRAMDSMFSGQDLMDPQLRSIQVPTLIVWGGEDQVIPPSTATYLHQEIPRSRVQLFAGCGHLILEVCGSKVGPSIAAFLRPEVQPINERIER